MASEREGLQARVQQSIRKGDLSQAFIEYHTYLEQHPDDLIAVSGLAELCLQGGREAAAVPYLLRVADSHLEEGFLAKAAALYKRVLKIGTNDHALLSLTEIAAQEGHLIEARRYLVRLEQDRRARGDDEGADACLASLDALVNVRAAPVAAQPSTDADVAAPAAPAAPAVERPADGPAGEPVAAPASDDAAGDSAPPTADTAAGLAAERRTAPKNGLPAGRRPGAGRKRTTRARPLQHIFDEMRESATTDEAVAAAHERFDLAQYHLRDGHEDAAMIELRAAARAPQLRFAASAQLGRLHIGRGELRDGIEWLERASSVPPVSPDEGLAVLYERADALQRVDEPERALAAFLELDAQRRNYRDVRARISALSSPPAEGATEGTRE